MKTPRYKRVLAWIGIGALLAVYVAAFVSALMKSDAAAAMFRASLACTIIIPVFLYVVLMVARSVKPRKSEVIDGVILAEDRVLKDADGEEASYVQSLLEKLSHCGIEAALYRRKDGELSAYLTSLAQKGHLKKDRYIYIDSDRDNVRSAQKAGFGGIIFTDILSLENSLRSIGVKL